jgi:hypothetical protein
MSVQSSEGTTSSPLTNPPGPAVRIFEGAAEGRGIFEGLEIPNPVDKHLSKAIAQARTLAIDEESILEFPTPSATRPSTELPASLTKPIAPTVGGITLVTKDEWAAWTGGKPYHTWTGLDSSIALLEHTSPNQFRPVYVSAAQKGYNFRRTGHKPPSSQVMI